VKHLDYEQKEALNELQRVQNAYDEKLKDITGSGQLARQKQSLLKLKAQTRTMALHEGVMLSTLFNCASIR
jgi:uridylate kinase